MTLADRPFRELAYRMWETSGEALREHARARDRLSQQAQWQVRDSMSYQLLSAEFRRIARAIDADAGRRDGEAVLEHYTQLTRTCVECHKHVRQDGGLRGSDVIRTMAPPRGQFTSNVTRT